MSTRNAKQAITTDPPENVKKKKPLQASVYQWIWQNRKTGHNV